MQNSSSKDHFIGRKNINLLYKKTMEKSGFQSELTPKESKTIVAKMLTTKMKEVFKSIDFTKVNNSNFTDILKQFNQMCVDQTSEVIKNSDLFIGEDSQISRVKFNRDFNSLPERKVKYLERPKNDNLKKNGNNKIDQKNDLIRGTDNILDLNAYGEKDELQEFFQPSSNNNPENFSFPMPQKFDEMQKMRQQENQSINQRPPTPEFLRPMETQDKKDSFQDTMPQIESTNSFSHSQNIEQTQIRNDTNQNNDFGTYGGSDSFFPLDGMDEPLLNTDIVEDNSSFEDRLKKLQMERTDIKPTSDSNNNSFQETKSVTFNDNLIENSNFALKQPTSNNYDYNAQINEPSQNNSVVATPNSYDYNVQIGEPSQNNVVVPISNNQFIKNDSPSIINNSTDTNELIQKITSSIKYDMEKKINEVERNSIQSYGLIDENRKLLEKVKSLENEISQFNSIKQTISSNFEQLKQKNNALQLNLNILNQREVELNNKENDIKSLINNYKFLLNSRFYQMNITSDSNISKYSYYFDEVKNISSIKVVSYSLPNPRFNIDGNNNLLKIIIDGEEKQYTITKGFYTIDNLLQKLSITTKLNFELTDEQKVVIISDLHEFQLVPTLLSYNVLGFKENLINKFKVKNEADPSEFNNILEADFPWDLRLQDKLYLYFKNINDEPISLIYFNGKGESQVNFESPITLSNFDVEIRDQFNNFYDFNNQNHSISLQLEVTNQLFEINNFETVESDNIVNNLENNISEYTIQDNVDKLPSPSKSLDLNQKSLRIDNLDIIIN